MSKFNDEDNSVFETEFSTILTIHKNLSWSEGRIEKKFKNPICKLKNDSTIKFIK